MSTNVETFGISLPRAMREELDAIARRRADRWGSPSATRSSIIREAIAQYIQNGATVAPKPSKEK